VHTDSTNTAGAFAFYMLRRDFPSPQDWRNFDTINFWMRNRANPTSLLISLYDSDGDRFLAQLNIQYPEEGTWMLYSVSLRNLFHPDWAEEGNGVLDLGHVQAFSVLEMFFDEHDHDTWFDSFYLGGPL